MDIKQDFEKLEIEEGEYYFEIDVKLTWKRQEDHQGKMDWCMQEPDIWDWKVFDSEGNELDGDRFTQQVVDLVEDYPLEEEFYDY